MLALGVYTVIVCSVCYLIIAPTSNTPNLLRGETHVEAHQNNDIKSQHVFSQLHPARIVFGTNTTNSSTISQNRPAITSGKISGTNSTMNTNNFKMERADVRPSVLHFYRSMKDNQPLDRHCSTCAVVSSSGQLLGKRAGAEIDNASCVLRTNTAAVKGFEEDVGNRTTLRVLSFVAAKALKKDVSSILLVPNRPEMILYWGLHHPKRVTQQKLANEVSSKYADYANFFSQTKEGEDAASALFTEETGYNRDKTKSWLSTGWFTIMVALDMCREIHIYGMVSDDYCQSHQNETTKYHYFQEKGTPTECGFYSGHEAQSQGGHRFITEKAVFARWGKKYNFQFHHPMWSIEAVNISKPMDTPFLRRQLELKAKNAKGKT